MTLKFQRRTDIILLLLLQFAGHCIFTNTACADLKWESLQKEFRAKDGETSIKIEFSFINQGSSNVQIQEVKASCGCLTPHADKNIYAPGERGTVSANYSIGSRFGEQRKQIFVKTTSPFDQGTQLDVRIFLPELIEANPDNLMWPLNSGSTSKTMKFVCRRREAHIVGVDTTDMRLLAKLNMTNEGEYEVAVTPRETKDPMKATLRVELDYPISNPKIYAFPINVGIPILQTAK